MSGSNFIDDRVVGLLEKALDLRALRQSVIASNVSNLDTPGYKTVDISFKESLKEAMEKDNQKGIGEGGEVPLRKPAEALYGARNRVHYVRGLQSRPDGNNVDIDREMIELVKNSSGYNMAVQLLIAKFKILASAIKGG